MTDEFPNPVSLLTQFAMTGGEADEILVCTFNQNLSFFERHLLGPCRATGARVTILGDITMAEHDLAAISRANRRYYAGNVSARRSFHSKLIVLASTTSATVAIGSGNLTVSGWLGNDELWTIHRASEHGASPVVTAVGNWCRRLPATVRVSNLGRDALLRVANLLEQFEADGDYDVQLLDSLDQPIIDQLPEGPVDQLSLYAPFHDSRAEATRQLLERLRPRHTRIAYQPGLTSASGEALAAVLPVDVDLVELAATPYRHGKLIEWCVGSQWWSVTGSPNLSTAALCRSAISDGNVELAVLARTDAPLLPDGATADPDAVRHLHLRGKQTGRREVPLLLSATLIDNTVEVEFTRVLPEAATLQMADPVTPPDQWPVNLIVDAGVERALTEAQPAGSRVRLKLADGRFSNSTFVADPVEVLAQAGRSTRRPSNPPPTIDDIFTNPQAARRFLELLHEFPTAPTQPSTPSSATPPSVGDHERTTVGDWRDYLAAAETALSPQLISFALGQAVTDLTQRTATQPTIREPDWDGADTRDVAGDLDDDDPDEAADETPAPTSDYQIKQQTRVACWRNLTSAPMTDPLRGLMKLRMMLTFVTAGGFNANDSDWVPTVLDTVRLMAELDVHANVDAEVGSLTAVALAVTSSTLSPVITTTHHARQRSTERAVVHLVDSADRTLIEQYASDLRSRFGYALSVDSVVRFADRIVKADPLDDAVEAMRNAGFSPTRHGNCIEIQEDVSSPTGSALAAISRCRSVNNVSVMCHTTEGWTLAAWDHPYLLVVQPGTNRRGWGIVYDLTSAGLDLMHTGELGEISDREIEMFTPLNEPGERAIAILNSTGWKRDGSRR